MTSNIVLGAGILGASTAYHLARAGKQVIIVDRKDAGQATDAAAGIICPWISQRRNKAWYQLVKNGARYYETLIPLLKEDGEEETGYKKVGAISLHTDEQKLEKMIERAIKRREDAPEMGDITRLSQEDTKKLFPPLSDEYASVHISGAARVNGRSLRDAMLRAAVKNGAQFIEGDASILSEGNNVKGIQIRDEKRMGDRVLVTTGAWASDVIKPLGVTFKVSAQKAQIIHLQYTADHTGDWPVIMPPNNQYILSFDQGRVVIGATHEDEVGYDLRVTAGGMHEILDKALKVAPGLAESEVVETRVGFRPFTPGFLPIIGPLPGYDGIFLANGLGASGLTSGPYLGAELAKLAQGLPTELDLTHYDVAGAIE
ncbi:FAD-dependent oxidoreductase [Bacillus carboniphilus]